MLGVAILSGSLLAPCLSAHQLFMGSSFLFENLFIFVLLSPFAYSDRFNSAAARWNLLENLSTKKKMQ